MSGIVGGAGSRSGVIGVEVNPTQPAFLIANDGDEPVGNAGGTGSTLVLDQEIFDIGSNVSSNTFTAPVTGKYIISGQCRVDAGSTPLTNFRNAVMYIKTSNRNYVFGHNNMYTNEDDQMMVWGTALCDMDINDTCYLEVYFTRYGASGGTTALGGTSSLTTSLSGILIA